MIFERRAYTLRPGRIQPFWAAQEEWNTEAVFGPILSHNIGYFSAVSGRADEVVHLYRFDTLDQWHALYGRYYAAQSPDYFALVRPWMLQQRNMVLAPPPIAGLAACWTGPHWTLPAGLGAGSLSANAIVVETTMDFFPGGLPRYWEACREHRPADAADLDVGLLAELVSLVGRLHRVIRYEIFPDLSEAHRRRDARDADPRWRSFVAAYGDRVAAETVSLLRPSPLPSRRSFLGGAGIPATA